MVPLKRIAFVAMPFRIKSTNLPPGKGPATVDFDALWNRSIFPALNGLGYTPIRADNQTGSVIIKDMLEQLVFADLVLADVSIPNGNVYYEAGVRHAARSIGCILLSAAWARPLFDLAQITQIRYELPTENPTEGEYAAVRETLVRHIPQLVDSQGPVFELTRIGDTPSDGARRLRELSSVLFEFETRLQAARLKAADGDKSVLRQFAREDHLDELPSFALQELTEAVRDHLNWGELQELIRRLPASVREQPYFLEQEAVAMGRLGDLHSSIASLEQVASKFGDTPERLGTIAGRYREWSRRTKIARQRKQRLSKAIDAYERGMLIDLNEYYCAHKLMVTLVERGRHGDAETAERVADRVKAACERAELLGRADEWLTPTMLIHAFFERSDAAAERYMNEILDRGWANWKLMGLLKDLTIVVDAMGEGDREVFQEILGELYKVLPVSQERLCKDVLPFLKEAGGHYKKTTRVHARPARAGEVIVSWTDAGEETSNSAREGDMVVRNLTTANEEYLVGAQKFAERYTVVQQLDDEWTVYEPRGEVRALEITHDLTTLLGVGEEFYIMAPWKSEQFAQEGDYLVSPLPGLVEVYRIGKSEFEQTYALSEQPSSE